MSQPTILVVEDDRPLQDAVVTTLETAGFNVLAAGDGGEALKILGGTHVDLVVSDVEMRPMDGRELLRRLQRQPSAPPLLLMSAYGTIDQAVAAMRDGAVDYLVKPFEAEQLEERVARYARSAPSAPATLSEPIAIDPVSRKLVELASRVAQSDVTVLLNGESGTGKEVLARFIHARSKRHAGPFVAVNCAAIPEQMLEALLFGHEKGAFTGAQARSVGKFVQANGGTLLLDEVTEMELGLQAKLLRVLQEREVEPLGASKPVPLDVRVLATSNRDLEQAVRDGVFREDLYYRLSVFPLRIAPLRERPGDIVPLAERFVAARSLAPSVLSMRARSSLEAYAWPGNVRELENVIQRALLLADGAALIDAEHLVLAEPAAASVPASTDLAASLWEEETRRIVAALEKFGGTRRRAAAELGISDRTLRYKLSKIRASGVSLPGDRSFAEVLR
jgi:two-component system response regulator FlrC